MPRRETACAGQARDVLALEQDVPARRGQDAGEEVEERRLARAVGTDDRAQLALAHLEVDAVDGGEAPERLGEASALEQTRAAAVPARRRARQPRGLRQAVLQRADRHRPAPADEPRQRADDAVGKEEHDEHEGPADEDLPVLEVLAEEIAHPDEDAGADERAEQRARPAEQRHDQDGARHLPVDVLDRHELQHDGEQRAGQPREEARDREGHEPDAAGVVAARRRARLVGLHRAHRAPEGRAQQMADRQHRDDDDGGDHVVPRDRALRQPPAEGLAQVENRQVAEAVGAAGDRRPHEDDVVEDL